MESTQEEKKSRRAQLRDGWERLIHHPLIARLRSITGSLLNKLLPPYAPLIDLDEKLVKDEVAKDHAIIHHFQEFQILLGMVGTIAGVFLTFSHLYFVFLFLASLLLVLTGFEIEEIYITSKRLMIRRIGLFERIIRIPSDEEHLVEHLVSYRIGRAPFNLALVGISLLSFFTLLDTNVGDITQFVLFLSATIIFIYALRLGKRSVTLEFAGGHQVILGLRKGVPYHILKTMMDVIYAEEIPELQTTSTSDVSDSSNDQEVGIAKESTPEESDSPSDELPKPADV